MRLRSVLAIVVTLPMTALVPGGVQARQSARLVAVRASLQRELTRYVATRRMPEHLSAVSLAVTFRGSRAGIDLAAGRTRYTRGSLISANALWEIGSNTKAFTSVIVLQLEAEHKLAINDTLGKWLPQYPAWRRITIRRLLNMTSGIPELENAEWARAYLAAPDQVFTAPWLVSYALGLPLTRGYDYSNTNYILAQMIIERATHDSYAYELRKRIFVPLGLHNTYYSSNMYPPAVTKRLPAGYFFMRSIAPLAPILGTDQSHHNISWGQGAGGIISSLQDLAKWARAVYTGRELPGTQQRELESLVSEGTGKTPANSGKPISRTTLDDPAGFGLGISQATTAAQGTFWTYTGATLGFEVLHVYLPRSGTVVVLGVNSISDSSQLTTLWNSVYQVLHRAGQS